MRTYWRHIGDILETYWGHIGDTQGSHSKTYLNTNIVYKICYKLKVHYFKQLYRKLFGLKWVKRIGDILETYWGHIWHTLGTHSKTFTNTTIGYIIRYKLKGHYFK